MKRLILFFILVPIFLPAQTRQPDAARIKLGLKKLNFLGAILYVAAHPDDENTRIITYMANDRLAATAYLSMTRGDGGQNLVGPEIRDQLGLIRTQELLAARRIDGGRQFFTRANDFGFSKSADETFRIWGKDLILGDVVKIFRQYQPDVIITRFPPDERAGHGHHTASAILAQEAFDLAADPNEYPEQVKTLGIWQTKVMYTNTGRWWNKDINEKTPGIVTMDVGGYSPLLGASYSEIAAISRSQHKSQGFGSEGTRGYQPEFLEYIKGEKIVSDVFEKINTTWTRVNGGDKIQLLVDQLIAGFNEEKPEASIASLLQLRRAIIALEPGVWKTRKLQETEQLILDCAGIFLDASAENFWIAPGQPVSVNLEVINRSPAIVQLDGVMAPGIGIDSAFSLPLTFNIPFAKKMTGMVLADKAYSGPYWLNEPHSVGSFTVKDEVLIGRPEGDAAVSFSFLLSLYGEKITVARPLVFRSVDPVKGELIRPVEVVPPVFVNLSDPVMIFSNDGARAVSVKLKSTSGTSQEGQLALRLPKEWRAEPASIPFMLTERGEEQTKQFKIFPPANATTAVLSAVVTIGGKEYDRSARTIAYDHIPVQTLMPKAEAKIVRLNIRKEGKTIGYIRGAGDEVPAALRSLGYEVWEMKNEEVNADNLKRVDAVVLGIRALNTNERIPFLMNDLLQYVKNGGTMVVQYNNYFELGGSKFSPYPIKLSRERVTEEDAPVRVLKPEHPVMNIPNKIVPADFDGWVQERGLYFPEKWENADAILSMNDKNDTHALDGGLLISKYGSGYYVYTGLSFFRELPEGVAGAYKLFANIVSLRGSPAKKKK